MESAEIDESDDQAVKYVVLAIVLLFAGAVIVHIWEERSGKKLSSSMLLTVRIGTVAVVAFAWYMTAQGYESTTPGLGRVLTGSVGCTGSRKYKNPEAAAYCR